MLFFLVIFAKGMTAGEAAVVEVVEETVKPIS
jgi:hypothetical protein